MVNKKMESDEKKLLIEALMTTTVTAIMSFILNSFISSFIIWIIAIIIVLVLSILISSFYYEDIKDLKDYISKIIHNHSRLTSIILFFTWVFLLLITPYYINFLNFIPFLIPIVFLFAYNRFKGYNKFFALLLIIASIIEFYYFLKHYFYSYPILTNLYFNGGLITMPDITTISTYRLSYILIGIYSVVNMIFAYLFYNQPKKKSGGN